MDRASDPSTVFYVATDSMEVYEAMWARFGEDRVLWLRERLDENCFEDPRSVACIRLALAELVLLSHTLVQMGSVYSSFSEVVAYMAGMIIPSNCDAPWMKFPASGGFLRPPAGGGDDPGFTYNDVSIVAAFAPEEADVAMEALSSWMEAIGWYTEILLVFAAPVGEAGAAALAGELRRRLRAAVPDELERQRVRLVVAAWEGGEPAPAVRAAAYNLAFRLSSKRYVLKLGAHALSRGFFSANFPFPFALYRGLWWEDAGADGVFMVERWKLLEARGIDERIARLGLGLEHADVYQRLIAGPDCEGDGCFPLWAHGGAAGAAADRLRLWQRPFAPDSLRHIGPGADAGARGRLRADPGAERRAEPWGAAAAGASARWECRGRWDLDARLRRSDRGALCVLRGGPGALGRGALGVRAGDAAAAGGHSLAKTEIASIEELRAYVGGGRFAEMMNQMLLVASIPRQNMRQKALNDMGKQRAYAQNWYSRFLPPEVMYDDDAEG